MSFLPPPRLVLYLFAGGGGGGNYVIVWHWLSLNLICLISNEMLDGTLDIKKKEQYYVKYASIEFFAWWILTGFFFLSFVRRPSPSGEDSYNIRITVDGQSLDNSNEDAYCRNECVFKVQNGKQPILSYNLGKKLLGRFIYFISFVPYCQYL